MKQCGKLWYSCTDHSRQNNRLMSPAYTVTSATDTHSQYAMILSVSYLRVAHWNIKSTLSFWLKFRENLIYTFRPTIQAVTPSFILSQRYKQPPFLLLYEAKLLGNWLQTFRENVGVTFLKRSKCPTQFFALKI